MHPKVNVEAAEKKIPKVSIILAYYSASINYLYNVHEVPLYLQLQELLTLAVGRVEQPLATGPFPVYP